MEEEERVAAWRRGKDELGLDSAGARWRGGGQRGEVEVSGHGSML